VGSIKQCNPGPVVVVLDCVLHDPAVRSTRQNDSKRAIGTTCISENHIAAAYVEMNAVVSVAIRDVCLEAAIGGSTAAEDAVDVEARHSTPPYCDPA